jgi:hypothetical protein
MTSISQIKTFNGIKSENLYLIIIHADKIPPHLGIIYNSLYFSLTAKGKEMGIPINEKLAIINKRKIPCLFLDLKTKEISKDLLFELKDVFNTSAPLTNKTTCLAPIVVYFFRIYKLIPNAPLLHGLIDTLKQKELIDNCFALHLRLLNNNIFELPSYNITSVLERIIRIEELNKKRTT